MEVVYFLISVIEIILTCYLVFVLKRARAVVEEKNAALQEALPYFNINYKKGIQILRVTSLAFKIYKKYIVFEKYAAKFTQAASVLAFLKIIKQNKNKKFRLIPFLRKILFYI